MVNRDIDTYDDQTGQMTTRDGDGVEGISLLVEHDNQHDNPPDTGHAGQKGVHN